ncbi:YgfZ/GcvT domain-containing protein [Endozoicomonas arenosclerae]|uniref:CAF17-like 4Fe-4S cluster assembly/insertion protein YgfZ n=1 Tax=Endozoicomonas arenosclerae TaxID=1633495 RepID=UPI000782E434|nr:folate-binding protein YgfZ [Endozoicomonas arenosclerae]
MTTDREERFQQFFIERGARYENGQLLGFSDNASTLDPNSPTVSVLDQKALLSFCGPDSLKFLQGQLTCNVDSLSTDQFSPGAACTPKGRMYTSFTLLNAGPEQFMMAMDKGLIESTKATLGKYAVFYKTDLVPDEKYICLGLSGTDAEQKIAQVFSDVPDGNSALNINQQGWLLNVSGSLPRYQLWITREQLEIIWSSLTEQFKPAGQNHWQLLDCLSVEPSVTAATVDKYIPQHLNLPSLKSVSFRKGCYTGQEIVARMQNLGQLKSRCYRLSSDQKLTLEADTRLFNSAGKGIGEVVECVEAGEGTEILAVIRVEAAEANDVHLESGEGLKLTCHPLPYEVDPKQELQY